MPEPIMIGLSQSRSATLASLPNLATATKAIQLPSKTHLDYFKQILWGESLAQDRFSVMRTIRSRSGAPCSNGRGICAGTEPGGYFILVQQALSNKCISGKQTSSSPFTRTTRRIECVKVEPDID